jgi:signal transduction histidine kinase
MTRDESGGGTRETPAAPPAFVAAVSGAGDAHAELAALRREVSMLADRLRETEVTLAERDLTLRRAERMAALGHTLAGVAHELNNPLAAISGFAQLLLRAGLSEEDQSALETIAHEAARAARIVRGLLAFSRRQGTGSREDVDLSEVARYILHTQRYAMETRGIRGEGVLAAHLPPVLADRANLEQVVLNLIVNARQALEGSEDGASSGAGGEAPCITVTTRDEGDLVTLVVADNGPGIPPELLEHVWDPFVTTKDEQQGTGLGLSMVHGIVISHGGAISVDSSPGRGAVFTVTLPAHRGAPPPEDGAAGTEAAGALTGAQASTSGSAPRRDSGGAPSRLLDILVIDDEAAILAFVARYFASRGHAVLTAADGDEALRIARGAAFDVVICDLRMPGLDGFEVIRRLRALPDGADARYVITTGDHASPASRRGLATIGVEAVISKPYDITVLRDVVEQD